MQAGLPDPSHSTISSPILPGLLYIQFSHTGSQALIDQVLLEATSEVVAVPEPATLAQLALLGLPLLLWRRTRL